MQRGRRTHQEGARQAGSQANRETVEPLRTRGQQDMVRQRGNIARAILPRLLAGPRGDKQRPSKIRGLICAETRLAGPQIQEARDI